MSEVSTFTLYLLRAGYLYIAVGLAIFQLPALLHPEIPVPSGRGGSERALGDGALGGVGLRYPVKMLPLLFFEFLWKAIWLVAFGLPLLLSRPSRCRRDGRLVSD